MPEQQDQPTNELLPESESPSRSGGFSLSGNAWLVLIAAMIAISSGIGYYWHQQPQATVVGQQDYRHRLEILNAAQDRLQASMTSQQEAVASISRSFNQVNAKFQASGDGLENRTTRTIRSRGGSQDGGLCRGLG